jgi:hypothetical protein
MTDAGRANADFTVEIFDVSALQEVGRSGDEVRYYCPFCSNKRGKADTDGKLYYNVAKQKGYCFKCHTSVYPESAEGWSVHRDEVEYRRSIERLLRSDSIFEGLESPLEVQFDFPDLTKDLLVYLKERNPYLIPLKDCLGLRAWRGRDTGVVIPFIYRDAICKFQCRFVTKRGQPLAKDDKMKYYTSPGPKPLYCPFHIFSDFHGVGGEACSLTICEGVFDAVALAIMGFPNPCAILGDKLTPLQMRDIRHLDPLISTVYVCLDDYERSKHTEKLIRKFLPCVEKTEIFVSWSPGKDPEEFLRATLQTSETFREQCSERVLQWVRAASQLPLA